MDARPNTSDGDRLDLLVTLVEAWEEKHWPIDSPDPVEAILFAMEHRGLSRRDLEPLIGSRARVAEVLNRKRSLTLPMIRRLHEGGNSCGSANWRKRRCLTQNVRSLPRGNFIASEQSTKMPGENIRESRPFFHTPVMFQKRPSQIVFLKTWRLDGALMESTPPLPGSL